MACGRILLIEPFCGGSHRQLMDILQKYVPSTELISQPAKKWHWKARTSSLYLSQVIPTSHNYRTLFASSVLNLAELVALRPDLGKLWKILYFHENQLEYPVRKQQDRDFQFGYNQILSSLVADEIVFNSKYNMDSFLSNINHHLKLIPDQRPKGIPELLKPKCKVLYFPLQLPENNVPKISHGGVTLQASKLETDAEKMTPNSDWSSVEERNYNNSLDKPGFEKVQTSDTSSELKDVCNNSFTEDFEINSSDVNSCSYGDHSDVESDNVRRSSKRLKMCEKDCQDSEPVIELPECVDEKNIENVEKPLHIVWPHRWEHDKDPEMFFRVLYQLMEAGLEFTVSVLGENFTEIPAIFEEAYNRLGDRISHWGYQECKTDYYRVLQEADCVVSTTKHEFFGVAMLEAVHLGCYPLCPNKLVYPEIFPKEYLYNTDQQLFKKLKRFCKIPDLVRKHEIQVDVRQYSWNNLESEYKQLLLGKLN